MSQVVFLQPKEPTEHQRKVLRSKAKVVLAGGAAGGGKTFLIVFFILKYISPGWVANVFRHERDKMMSDTGIFDVVMNEFGGGKPKIIYVPKPKFSHLTAREMATIFHQSIKKVKKSQKAFQQLCKSQDYPLAAIYEIQAKSNRAEGRIVFTLKYLIDAYNVRRDYAVIDNSWHTLNIADVMPNKMYYADGIGIAAGWYIKKNMQSSRRDKIDVCECEDAPIDLTKSYTASMTFRHLNERHHKSSTAHAGIESCFNFIEEAQEIQEDFIINTVFKRSRDVVSFMKLSREEDYCQNVFTCNPSPGYLFDWVKPLLNPNADYTPIQELCEKTWLLGAAYENSASLAAIDPSSAEIQRYMQTQNITDIKDISILKTFDFIPFRCTDNQHVQGYRETLVATQSEDSVKQLLHGAWAFQESGVIFPISWFGVWNYDAMLKPVMQDMSMYIITADFAHGSDKNSDGTAVTLWGLDFTWGEPWALALIDMEVPSSNAYNDVHAVVKRFINKYLIQIRKPLVLDGRTVKRSGIIMLEKTSQGISLFDQVRHEYGRQIDVVGATKSRGMAKVNRAKEARNYMKNVMLPQIIFNEKDDAIVTQQKKELDGKTKAFTAQVCAFTDGNSNIVKDDITDCFMFAVELAVQESHNYTHLIQREKNRVNK